MCRGGSVPTLQCGRTVTFFRSMVWKGRKSHFPEENLTAISAREKVSTTETCPVDSVRSISDSRDTGRRPAESKTPDGTPACPGRR